MKKNAFTLIELLAVIVILAIIALIATTIVLNIIEDTKKSSTLRSGEFYLDAVEHTITNTYLYHGGLANEKYPITKTGDVCKVALVNNECSEENTLKVEVNGEKPTGGYIEITGGNISNVSLIFDTKTLVKNDKGSLEYQTIPTPVSFAEDDWRTIVANLNSDVYKVGDTREIELTGFINEETDSNGLYTIRIANKTSAGDVCTKDTFEKDGKIETYSKTACGFVIEFEDIILDSGDSAKMNLSYTNVGGWKDSKMRTYVNDTIYNALPNELRDVIIDTTVVSSHGPTSGETNFVSEDKVYLLSTKEVWGKEGTSNIISDDTAETETRQLDYYKDYKNSDESLGVTTSNYSGAIKKINGSANSWWLRSANSNNSYRFYYVKTDGNWYHHYAHNTYGVAVAFRIG